MTGHICDHLLHMFVNPEMLTSGSAASRKHMQDNSAAAQWIAAGFLALVTLVQLGAARRVAVPNASPVCTIPPQVLIGLGVGLTVASSANARTLGRASSDRFASLDLAWMLPSHEYAPTENSEFPWWWLMTSLGLGEVRAWMRRQK